MFSPFSKISLTQLFVLLRAQLAGFGVLRFLLFKESYKSLISFKKLAVFRMVDDGISPVAKAVFKAALVVWLIICAARETESFWKLFGQICAADS